MNPTENQPNTAPAVPAPGASGTPPTPEASPTAAPATAPVTPAAPTAPASAPAESPAPATPAAPVEPEAPTTSAGSGSIDFTKSTRSGNIDPLATAAVPEIQMVANAQPITTASGQSIAELAESEAPAEAPAAVEIKVTEKKKISQKAWYLQWSVWTTAVFLVSTIIAMVFAFTRVQGASVEAERAEVLQTDLDEANRLLVKYGTMLGLKVNEYGRPIEGEAVEENLGIASRDYIYIGEWGLKIKIPPELKNVSYSFDNAIINSEGKQYASAFCVTGVPTEADHVPAYAQFGETDNMKLGCLTRYDKGKIPEGQNAAIYTDSKYDYVYSLARFAASSDGTEDQELEAEATMLVQEMLSAENISIF